MINLTQFYARNRTAIKAFRRRASYVNCSIAFDSQLNKLDLKGLSCLFVRYEETMLQAISNSEREGDEWYMIALHCLAKMELIISEAYRQNLIKGSVSVKIS